MPQESRRLPATNKILTYTEERKEPERIKVQESCKEARVLLVLGFGFHPLNIGAITIDGGLTEKSVFMTALGIKQENYQAMIRRMQIAVKTTADLQLLTVKAQTLMDQLEWKRRSSWLIAQSPFGGCRRGASVSTIR
jgi:hypothetical protein